MAQALLGSVRYYHEHARWNCGLFLLMPDHVHALISFPVDTSMSNVIAAWKSYQTKRHNVRWQANYFDHRIRSHKELDAKAAYIRHNPVAKSLCRRPEDWPWFYCSGP
jgi:REP element-mobilizing transposase RayT